MDQVIRLYALGLTLGMAFGPRLVGAQDFARINGEVLSRASRAAIAGAQVELAPGTRRSVSDDSGRFRIDGIAPGNVTLLVRRIGFVPESLYITLGEREDHDVVIELKQSVPQLDTVAVAGKATPIPRGRLAHRPRTLRLHA